MEENKITSFIKKMNFRWSDLIVVLGVLFAAPVMIERTNLLRVHNPTETVLPIWLLSLFFAGMLISTCVYFFIERKNNILDKRPSVIIAFAMLIIVAAVTIFVQPDEIHDTVYIQKEALGNIGDPIEVVTTISYKIRLVIFYNIVCMFIAGYIVIFIFPKRLYNIKLLEIACWCMYGFLFFSLIYSLITEYTSYLYLFKFIIGQVDIHELEIHAPMGVFTHRNVYGMFLVFVIYLSIFAYQYSKNKYHFVPTIVFSINLIFTICKTGIILLVVGMLVYVIVELVLYTRTNKKKGIIYLSIVGGVVALIAITTLVIYLAVPSINEKINNLLRNGETLQSRTNIWKTAFAMLRPAWWISGKGYWIFDICMRECNWAAQNDVTGSPHNWFVGLLSRGGILLVAAFIALLAYSVTKLIKLYKLDRSIASILAVSLVVFFIYSNFEDYYYISIIYVIGILMITEYLTNQKDIEETVQ